MTATPRFLITNAKLIRKNSLVGVFDVQLPSGMIIRGVMLLESNGRRWVNMPSEAYQKADGTKAWKSVIEFAAREVRDRFQRQVLPLAEMALLGEES
jgi:DNA-binding cell septation regulator SpoVG